MRARLLAILLLATLLAGCGGSSSTSQRAAELVERDWEFIAESSHFIGRPDLDDSEVDDVECPAIPPDGGTIVCTARVRPVGGAVRDVPVNVRIDDADTVTGWDLGG